MLKRTMKLEEKKFVFKELVGLTSVGYVQNTESIHILQHNQQEMWNLADRLSDNYHELLGEAVNGDFSINTQSFLLNAKEEIFRGGVLNHRNYLLLAHLTTILSNEIQSYKLQQLVSEGYWEGVTQEDISMDSFGNNIDGVNNQATNQNQAQDM